MILITSAKYENPELQSEFGKIPPSFLPLGGKRLYEYQRKLFEKSDEKVVLSLSQSFKMSISDEVKLKKLDIEILFVPDGLSLGESITYAVNMNLPISETLKILHGDTYFESLNNSDDSVNISLVESSYEWTYVLNDNKSLLNFKNSVDDTMKDYVLSGYFDIKNPYKFIQALVQTKYSFINALIEYSKNNPISIIKNNTWLDFGLVTNYFHSKKSITTQRAFNSLVIENGYVEKSSSMVGKLDAEINWFENFPIDLSLYIPRFYADKNGGNSYKTEYLYTSTLSELYVFGKLPLHIWKKIFSSLENFLSKLHQNDTNDKNINFDYTKKTNIRIKEFVKDNNIDLNKPWIFNHQKIPSIQYIIDDLEQYLDVKNTNFKFIHGDFCFSNIMYDFKSNEIKTFDPRGRDFEDKLTVYGDERYDLAKLMHSVVGLYDFIISGFYTCKYDEYKIDFKIDVTEELILIEEEFIKIFNLKDNKEMYAIMIHLFISMLPLHNDDKTKQYALLANAFRLYNMIKKDEK